MILPDLVLHSRKNQRWQYSGIDSLEHCRDKKHFLNYPHSVEYVYNSRGFRDLEWPTSLAALRDAIWCIGDSFTVGIGQPLAHIWPQVLSDALERRTINISMDGASNDWIYRRVIDIMRCVDPRQMIVMWSYTHRRESHDTALSDESRRILASKDSILEDYAHWVSLSDRLHAADPRIIQISIPDFHPPTERPEDLWNAIKGEDWPIMPKTISELQQMPKFILNEMINYHKCYDSFTDLLATQVALDKLTCLSDVLHISKTLDWARDYHHFDILTAQWIVDQIRSRIVT